MFRFENWSGKLWRVANWTREQWPTRLVLDQYLRKKQKNWLQAAMLLAHQNSNMLQIIVPVMRQRACSQRRVAAARWIRGFFACFAGSHPFYGLSNRVTSWRSTERYEDCIFWKRSVSLSFLGVFLCCVCFVCVCVWGLFRFDFARHLAFCFSPVLEQCENSWSTTRRFDDRPSLERRACTTWAKKKSLDVIWTV